LTTLPPLSVLGLKGTTPHHGPLFIDTQDKIPYTSTNKKEFLSTKLEHCGLYDEFLCHTFTSLCDPSLSDNEVEQAVKDRLAFLRLGKEMGTEA
jgi:hypothetical protein